MELSIKSVDEYFETTFRKWTRSEKLRKKKRLKRLHRGTNKMVAKRGYKRLIIPGTKRKVRVRLSGSERIAKQKTGRQLGRKTSLRK